MFFYIANVERLFLFLIPRWRRTYREWNPTCLKQNTPTPACSLPPPLPLWRPLQAGGWGLYVRIFRVLCFCGEDSRGSWSPLSLKSTGKSPHPPPPCTRLGEVWLEENWPWVHPGQTRVKDLIWSAGYLLTTVHLQDRYFWQRSQHWRYTTLSGSFLDTTIYLINASPAEEGTRHCVFYLQDMQSAFIQLLSLELYADPIHIDWFCSGR